MEWISVEDRLPEPEFVIAGNELVNVIVALDSGTVIDAYYHSKKGWEFIGVPLPFSIVTHWMPFPDPPKQD